MNKRGTTYDLQSLYDRLNRLYFDGTLQITVQWSQRRVQNAQRRIILGSYQEKKKLITLSRRLDSPLVPLYFVEHILFHEMLHAVFPREKHRMHTEKFKNYERLHPDYERAIKWEKESIGLLMKAPQIGLPLAVRQA